MTMNMISLFDELDISFVAVLLFHYLLLLLFVVLKPLMAQKGINLLFLRHCTHVYKQ